MVMLDPFEIQNGRSHSQVLETPSVPQVTINRDITSADLDSSSAFEGPEKLLEVWFSPAPDRLPASASPHGLKSVSTNFWKEMLDLVNCKILSVVKSRNIDAYLLSESSMFVFPHKLVLKTCGTTTLLCGLPRLLEIAAAEAGFPKFAWANSNSHPATAVPYRVFYSRKNFAYPERQQGPHRSWDDEVRFLDSMFRNGSAYLIGKMNGEHWYLYITTPAEYLTPSSTAAVDHERESMRQGLVGNSEPGASSHIEFGDETLEILMTDLDEQNARQFYLSDASNIAARNINNTHEIRIGTTAQLGSLAQEAENSADRLGGIAKSGDLKDRLPLDIHSRLPANPLDPHSFERCSTTRPEEFTVESHLLGAVITQHCGLVDIYPEHEYPDACVDSYLFMPCGYSANGVVPDPHSANLAHYWTVHVTPEPQCSYASFETNVPMRISGRDAGSIVQQVTNIFRPGRFSVTLFEAHSDNADIGDLHKHNVEFVEGYRRIDRIVHDLDGYHLIFRYFERDDWQGGLPRIGVPCGMVI